MMNSIINASIDSETKEVVGSNGVFGLWMNALWPSHLPLSFEDKKKVYLGVLTKLLEERKVILIVPNGVELITRQQACFDMIWDIPIPDMMRFIERQWPTDITDENNPEFGYYWYDPARCPGLGWVDPDDGSIIAS